MLKKPFSRSRRGTDVQPGNRGAAKKRKREPAVTWVLSILVVVLSAVLLFMLIAPRVDFNGMDVLKNRSGMSSSSSSPSGENVLKVDDKPKKGATLSTEQVASRILPCVVGVVQYQQQSLSETGEGSGIFMSEDGRIITNYHVIENASRLEVVLRSGKRYAATVIGSDARMDLAVIKIPLTKCKYAEFGDSDDCKVGEKVLAVGNPSGLQLAGSVTQGIISALNRNVDVGNGPMNLIQTDAAINPGNSGGALVNMYGQVVGINSAKIAQAGYEGLGFSIPVKAAKPVIDSILKYGYVEGRVKFGFECKEIDTLTAQAHDIPEGVYIDYVEPNSNAAQIGVKADDIITAIDGVAVKNTETLIVQRDKHKPGDTVKLTIYRRSEKKQTDFDVKLMADKGTALTSEAGDW